MVSGSLSETGRGGGKGRLPRFSTYTELYNYICPYYMAMGMTYDQFWDGDLDMVDTFRTYDRLRRQRENENAWLTGIYYMRALSEVMSTKEGEHSYPSEPYDIYGKADVEQNTDEDGQESEYNKDERNLYDKMKIAMEVFATNINIQKDREAKAKADAKRILSQTTKQTEQTGGDIVG